MHYHNTENTLAYSRYTTEELRSQYLLQSLFVPGELNLVYTDVDRAIVGGAMPNGEDVYLPDDKGKLGADFFLERRELGVINVGGPGVVTVDNRQYDMDKRDSLYIGRSSRSVGFASTDPENKARFFLTSYPAHTDYPTTLIKGDDANKLEMGDTKTCNERVIYQSLVPGKVNTCQLVMGFTELAEGSNWNTFPPHTHRRRMEVYSYFDLPEDHAVFHMMGQQEETRHIVARNGEAVVSPSWSMHCGVGTSNYSFVWAMGGENQIFDDMDHINVSDLK